MAFDCDVKTYPKQALQAITKDFPISKISWKQRPSASKRIESISSLQISNSPLTSAEMSMTLNTLQSTAQTHQVLEVQFSEIPVDVENTKKALSLLFDMAQDAYTICQFFNAQLSSNGYLSHRAVYTSTGNKLESTSGFCQLSEQIKVQRYLNTLAPDESSNFNNVFKGGQLILTRCDEYILAEIRLHIASCLTPRELDILALVMQGRSNPAISEKIGVSLSTVKNHLNNMFKKLGLEKRTQLLLISH